MAGFSFDNTYLRELLGFYELLQPEPSPNPDLLYINSALAECLNLDVSVYDRATLTAFFSGNQLPDGAEPIAQVYAGHQFGQFNPQPGDGRALIIGEVLDQQAWLGIMRAKLGLTEIPEHD